MQLIETLRRRADAEDSPFRAQLLREDATRLERLCELARSSTALASFKSAGMRIGWTQGDQRTHELKEALDPLLDLVYASQTDAADGSLDQRLEQAWLALHRARMERLVGCLSTPAPKPVD